MTIVMLQSYRFAVALMSIFPVMFVTWVILSQVDRNHSLLSQTESVVVSKVMAVFTAAIAIQFILTDMQFHYTAK